MNQKDRLTKLGMIKPTLQDPDFIIEDKRLPKDGSVPDRETAFVFVKSFLKEDGSRLYYFASVTVKKGNNEVIISNQEKSKSRIKRLLVNGKLAYINNSTLPSESNTSTQGDKPVNHVGGISGSKGTTNSGREQGNSEKKSEKLQGGEDVNIIDKDVVITNIKTAFGRNLENAINNNREEFIYPDEIKKTDERAAPNSLAYAQQSFFSDGKGTTNSRADQTNSEKNSENLQGGEDVMFSISPEVDAEYMAAVESGNMEKAGAMVKAAFKAKFPDTKVVDENGEPLICEFHLC